MIRSTFLFCHKTLMVTFEILGGVLLLGIGFLVFALWRFSAGPVDITFAADYVRTALRSESQIYDIRFDSIVAEWPEFDGPLLFGMSGFKILENGKDALQIDQVGLRVAKAPLLIGKIAPEAVILTRPALKLIRGTDGGYRLLVTDVAAAASADTAAPSPSIREIGESFFLGGGLPSSPLAAFASLERFVIRDARLIAEDRLAGVTWVLPKVSAELSREENLFDLNVEYQAPGRSNPSSVRAHLERDIKSERVGFDFLLNGVDIALPVRHFAEMPELKNQRLFLDGAVSGELDKEWGLQKLDGTLKSEKGRFVIGQSGARDFTFRNLSAHILYDRPGQKLWVRDTKVEIGDVAIGIEAERKISEEGKEVFPVRVTIPQLTFDRIHALWPQDARDTILADWMTSRLSKGVVHDLQLGLVVDRALDGFVDPAKIEASFTFENLTCDYRNPLVPATEASGSATIKNDALDIHVEKGKLADLTVADGRVLITNLTLPTPGEAVIDVKAFGPFAAALDYISHDPISLGKDAIGLDPKKVAGKIDMNVHVTFPAVKDLLKDQVKVTVDADLNDVLLPGIVRGLDVTGGPLALKVGGGSFTVSGKGKLGGRPLEMTYSEYLNPQNAPYVSDIKAKTVADLALRDHFGVNLERFVEGNVGVDLHYRQPDKETENIDLALDITPARVKVAPFGYEKPPGTAGAATCTALVKGGEIQEIKNLDVKIGKDLASGGNLTFGLVGKDRDVKKGSFAQIKLGDANDFSLSFEQPKENSLTFALKGKSLDGRPFLDTRAKAEEAGQIPSQSSVTVQADVAQMKTGDEPDQVLRNPSIRADQLPDGQFRLLDVDAEAGSGKFSLALRPDATGRMYLKITAGDAGSALHALDVYDRMVGGTLTFEGAQIPGRGLNDIQGKAEIRDFNVVKAPVLAQLINAFSITGLLEMLQNNGIAFTRLKADFIWKKTPGGRVIDVFDGRTAGASVGLTFGGRIDQGKGEMDISGTVSPMSEVNKIVGSIPLIGDLLTGGSGGGIIAATYAVKGDIDDPKVFVNPLSVLAPGFLRAILFENDNGSPLEEKGDRSTKKKSSNQ